MSWRFPVILALFLSLAVILHYSSQIRGKAFPEAGSNHQVTAVAASIQARPSVPRPASQAPHKTASSRDGQTTSPTAAMTSKSENPTTRTVTMTPAVTTSVTTGRVPSTVPTTDTLVTSQATPSPSQSALTGPTAAPDPSAGPRSQSPTVPSTARTTLTHPSTVSHTAAGTSHPSHQPSLPATLSPAPPITTTSQLPTQPTHAPETTLATRSTTHTAPPGPPGPGPTLAPQPSPASIGVYQVLNGSGLCIKAELGIQLIVQDEETVFSPERYFNVKPNETHASGICGPRVSSLLLNFPLGFVNFTFTKGENSYCISAVGASLSSANPERTYQGVKNAMVLFETAVGHSFKCVSEQSIKLSAHLELRTVNVQLQAFDFEGDHFGNVDECPSDYTVVLPVIGAVVLGLCAIGLVVYGVRLRRGSAGYQRI